MWRKGYPGKGNPTHGESSTYSHLGERGETARFGGQGKLDAAMRVEPLMQTDPDPRQL